MIDYPHDDRDLANLGKEHWANGLDDDNQLHLASGETLGWIDEMQAERDRTPEWLVDHDLAGALEHVAYDIGVEIARLTMLKQRVDELRAIVLEKSKNE